MGVEGLERIRGVDGVENLIITATEGQPLVPLPEGASYLGLIFARGSFAASGAESFCARRSGGWNWSLRCLCLS